MRHCVGGVCWLLVAVLGLGALASARAAEPKSGQTIDVDKLKPGDKLEVERFGEWIPAEFHSKISDRMIRVKRADVDFPVGALVSSVRLARGKTAPMAKEAAAAVDNPFETPEEKGAKKNVTRTWSDQSGKFKVEATLVRVDGDNVVLRRADNKEITVPASKLSDADQAYLGKSAAGSAEEPKAAAARINVTPTDVLAATQADVQPDAEWTYTPSAKPAGKKLSPVNLTLRREFHDRNVRMLFVPDDKRVFAVLSRSMGSDGTLYIVQSCDLASRSVGAIGEFGVDLAPVAISPDGKHVVARTERFGSGGQAELQLYVRDGKKVSPITAWLPFRHHEASSKSIHDKTPDDPNRPPVTHEGDVTWVDFLDNEHVLTASNGGEMALWKLPQIKPVYYVPAKGNRWGMFYTPALSADRSYLALPGDDGIALVRAADGETAGFLPAESTAHGQLAFSEDGKKLALVQYGRVRAWDLTSQELTRDFALPNTHGATSVAWADDSHLLVNGHMLVDVERRIPVLTGKPVTGDSVVLRGILWTFDWGHGQSSISGAPAMPRDLEDPAPGQSAEDLLVIKPGIEVQLELPAAEAEARTSVIATLKKNGVTVVPQSNIHLVGTIGPGQTKQVNYRAFGRRGPSQTKQVSVTDQVLTLSYVVDGETVWKHESRRGAPFSVHMQQGESVDDAVNRQQSQSALTFANVWVPAYVARVPSPPAKPAAK